MMSRASTLSGIGQQLAFSIGIALGALLLKVFELEYANVPVAMPAFTNSILIIGVLMASSAFFFMRLPLAPRT